MKAPEVATETALQGIPVTRGELEGGLAVVVGIVDAESLTNRAVIPRRDTRRKTGYQRDLALPRVNRLARDLRDGRVALPTAVLLNLREYQESAHITGTDGSFLFHPGSSELYVVDGQHRIAALQKLVEEVPERWRSFSIPFVCMLGADEAQEMRQFYVVNSTAKSVRTDLALDLLRQRAETETGVMEDLVGRGEDWKVRAQVLVEALNETPVWRHKIRLPRDPKGETTITSSGMAQSFKPLLTTPYFGSLTQENQIRVLDSFWRGVRKLLPELFDAPHRYSMQKSVGVVVMHNLLISVLEYLRSSGRQVLDESTYAEVLASPLRELEGDTTSGEPARGADFWLAGAAGAAGSFSSSAGQRVLVARMRALLPPIEVE